MSDKLQSARQQILDKIENGELPSGAKLPGIREFAEQLGVSLAIAQIAVNALSRDGILNTIPRSGSYVRNDWQNRILPENFRCFRPIWREVIARFVNPQIPEIRSCEQFTEGVYEIRTTPDVLFKQDEYLDLTELFQEAYPDRGDFFATPFQEFYTRRGKLCGIPVIFSPWVICCNTEMIRQAGAGIPNSNWSWDDFIVLIRQLRARYPAEAVFQGPASFHTSLIFRAGGSIMERNGDQYRVSLDSPESIRGLRCLKELHNAINWTHDIFKNKGIEGQNFRNGTLAMVGASREDVDFNSAFEWITLPLPWIPGGNDVTKLAGDLLCVRRQVNDFDQVREIIRLFLSQEVQDFIGSARYGIPVRRSSAIRSLNENDPRDTIFFSELTKIASDASFVYPGISEMLASGIRKIEWQDADPEETAVKLAQAIRTIVEFASAT